MTSLRVTAQFCQQCFLRLTKCTVTLNEVIIYILFLHRFLSQTYKTSFGNILSRVKNCPRGLLKLWFQAKVKHRSAAASALNHKYFKTQFKPIFHIACQSKFDRVYPEVTEILE